MTHWRHGEKRRKAELLGMRNYLIGDVFTAEDAACHGGAKSEDGRTRRKALTMGKERFL